MRNLLQSKTSIDRQLFLDLAALAVEDYSSEFFKHMLGDQIYIFAKEKNLQVVHTFVKHVHIYLQALGGGHHHRIEEMLQVFL